MQSLIIGDVHGKMDKYREILKVNSGKLPTFQLGDMGVGFYHNGNMINTSFLSPSDHWIHGNHDWPDRCVGQNGYLGRFGITDQGIFFVSGAFSVDAFHRTMGSNWWPNEQLSDEEGEAALNLYRSERPSILLTHDCPRAMYPLMLSRIGKPDGPLYENKTSALLQRMWDVHSPKVWLFGHWHHSMDRQIGDTRFVCLNELETLIIDS